LLLPCGERGFAVGGQLIDMTLEAQATVTASLVGGTEFLEVHAAGVAQAATSALGAHFPAAGMGPAPHGGQTEHKSKKGCGFLHASQDSNASGLNFRRDVGFRCATLEQAAGSLQTAGCLRQQAQESRISSSVISMR
jgi:hypothetical protein